MTFPEDLLLLLVLVFFYYYYYSRFNNLIVSKPVVLQHFIIVIVGKLIGNFLRTEVIPILGPNNSMSHIKLIFSRKETDRR